VLGNHDITLDHEFYEEHWQYFHNQQKQSSEDCLALVQNSPRITYLSHSSATIKLSSHRGPHTHFTVFGSPYSPSHGLWAFGYKPSSALKLWAEIPLNTDIVITHTPPASHCDKSVTKHGRAGCEELRRQLWRVRPVLHVCGHLHEGRGVEKVRWKSDAPSRAPFMEEGIEYWHDPGAGNGNKKQSIVDLTGRGRDSFASVPVAQNSGRVGQPTFLGLGKGTLPTSTQIDAMATMDSKKAAFKANLNHSAKNTIHSLAERSADDQPGDYDEIMLEPRVETGDARLDRAETCIVNAAIMANNWGGPKRFNKPIVVDIDLPVWEE